MKTPPEKNETPVASMLQRAMRVEIGFPSCVSIELVQSNELRHYEIFFSLTSLSTSAAVGFWVALATTAYSVMLLIVAGVFTLFALLFGGTAFYFRRRMDGGKVIKTIHINEI